jgi:hypothetical protein|tara:strand:- start:2261 stop:2488 length:228 start_codon:yes stop_codon:yes gene_type:complete
MNNYKITNKKSKKVYLLNENQKTIFFKKNKEQNYNEVNLTEQKRIRINKMLDNIAFVCFFAATILSTILIIETYY